MWWIFSVPSQDNAIRIFERKPQAQRGAIIKSAKLQFFEPFFDERVIEIIGDALNICIRLNKFNFQ